MTLDEIEEKARKAAKKHYHEFMDTCEWPDILEKYAELSNNYKKTTADLIAKDDRGSRLEDSEFADLEYYRVYRDLMARAIAENELVSEGYETDKKGYWMFKHQSTEHPKKKFGFWR